MPKKPKKVAEDKKVQKKPDFKKVIPVVNGVQARLGWMPAYAVNDQNYYMPQGEYDQKTRDDFSKLLKNRFNLNLEGNPQDAAKRIFTYNNNSFMDIYLKDMEEVDLMPDCQEKFQKKEKIAQDLEKGLFYEMAKGSLAIVPLGEYEPRQVMCDKDKRVFTVTEPFSQSDPNSLYMVYNSHEVKPMPVEFSKPIKPTFREDEPKRPEPVPEFDMKPPGRKPEPPKIRKFTMEKPVCPPDILKGRTREDLLKEVRAELEAERNIVAPGKFETKKVADPGEFTVQEPEAPKEPVFKNELKVPEKPESYDAAVFTLHMLQEESEKLAPKRDPRFVVVAAVSKPDPFVEKEPDPPILEMPDPVIPPEYKKIPGEPKPKYSFYKPKLQLRKPEGIEDPGDKLPDTPKYPKEPLKANPKKQPDLPADLRQAPPEPSRIKRFFSIFIPSYKAQVRDYDNWERERDAHAEALSRYNKEGRAWKEETIKIEAEHKAWEEKCRELDLDYTKRLNEFNEKKEAWNEAVSSLEPENLLIKAEYDIKLEKYEHDKNMLGDMFEQEKYAFEQEHKHWEDTLDEVSRKIRDENDAKRDKFEKEMLEFDRKDKEFQANFKECGNDPKKIEERKNELLAKHQTALEEYNERKENHKLKTERWESVLNKVKKNAEAANRDPEVDARDYEAFVRQRDAQQAADDKIADFMQQHPEIGKFETEIEEYREEERYREDALEVYEERKADFKEEHDEWEAEKKAYDKKKAEYDAYKASKENFEKAEQDYKDALKKLDRDAERETDRRIAENKRLISEFPAKQANYENEKEAYDRAYANWEKGCEDMKKPGGLIYKWEESVKQYNQAKEAHEKAVKEYEKQVIEYPGKLQAYNSKLSAHINQLERYNQQMEVYKEQEEKRKQVMELNEEIRENHFSTVNSNPLYRDYMFNKPTYDYGYRKWGEKLLGSIQYTNIQTYNADRYKKETLDFNKDFAKRKSGAPKVVSGAEAKAYNERVTEYEYLKTMPTGMHSYFRTLNQQEKAMNTSLNTKYRKSTDISKEDFREIAVDKMYFALVRDKAEMFAKRDYINRGTTKEIDILLDQQHARNAKNAMLPNKDLIKEIDDTYAEAKADGRITKTLQSGDRLRDIYRHNYGYASQKKGKAVKDPVFGEYVGDEKAIDKLKAKEEKEHLKQLGIS